MVIDEIRALRAINPAIKARILAEIQRVCDVSTAAFRDMVVTVATPGRPVDEFIASVLRDTCASHADRVRCFGTCEDGLVWPGNRYALAMIYDQVAPNLAAALRQPVLPTGVPVVVHYDFDGESGTLVVPFEIQTTPHTGN